MPTFCLPVLPLVSFLLFCAFQFALFPSTREREREGIRKTRVLELNLALIKLACYCRISLEIFQRIVRACRSIRLFAFVSRKREIREGESGSGVGRDKGGEELLGPAPLEICKSGVIRLDIRGVHDGWHW